MDILTIGQPFDRSITEWQEGTMFNYNASGHWLIYFLSRSVAYRDIQHSGGARPVRSLRRKKCHLLVAQVSPAPMERCTIQHLARQRA